MGDYRKLQVWERAHRLAFEVYQVTRTVPKEELHGVEAQGAGKMLATFIDRLHHPVSQQRVVDGQQLTASSR